MDGPELQVLYTKGHWISKQTRAYNQEYVTCTLITLASPCLAIVEYPKMFESCFCTKTYINIIETFKFCYRYSKQYSFIVNVIRCFSFSSLYL